MIAVLAGRGAQRRLVELTTVDGLGPSGDYRVGPAATPDATLFDNADALQFRRYERSQVFAFDFGGSIRAAALAMGGDWHDLGGELTDGAAASVSLQPLARIHETPERAWAADWIVAILVREGIIITPDVK